MANVVELRQRRPEYQMYLDFLTRSLRQPNPAVPPARLLSLLNAGFVDVPSKAFSQRRADPTDGLDRGFRRGLQAFDQDPALRRIHQRQARPEDREFARRSASPDALWSKRAPGGGLVEVIYRNAGARPGFVPRHVVAVVGPTPAGEAAFEEILGSAGASPPDTGYLLVESLDALTGRERDALAEILHLPWNRGTVALPASDSGPAGRVAGAPVVGPDRPARETGPGDTGDVCGDASAPGSVRVSQSRDEQLSIRVAPGARDRFLFVSQQYFRGWQARSARGEPLPVHQAGAGLTAVFLPAGVGEVELAYELPWYESWARRCSLLGLAGSVGLLGWIAVRKYRTSENTVPGKTPTDG